MKSATELAQRFETLAEEASALGFEDQAERARQRATDLVEPLLIMVVGEGKFGKSSLINALLGANVAPVSRLPKTWKVDLYEPVTGEESAVLCWRSRPGREQVVSPEEARRICEKQEMLAANASGGGTAWKSDLYQVKWRVRCGWSPMGASLVDTPGFAQLRSTADVPDVALYGSKGFTIESSDAFAYYYYRADVVLWCLKATKLEDEDTLDALRGLDNDDKVRLGVITHIDRLPEDRREEAFDVARKIYGAQLPELIGVAAHGAEEALKQETVAALRARIDAEYLARRAELKAGAAAAVVEGESRSLVTSLDSVLKQCEANAELRNTLMHRVTRAANQCVNETRQAVEAKATARLTSVAELLAGLYDESANLEQFEARVCAAGNAVGLSHLGSEIEGIVRAQARWFEAEVASTLAKRKWGGVHLGHGARRAHVPAAELPTFHHRDARCGAGVEVSMLGVSGAGEGLVAGAIAGATGAFLLGPIGWIGAGIGLVFSAMSRRRQALDRARAALKRFAEEHQREGTTAFEKWNAEATAKAMDLIESSFRDHNGMTVDEMAEKALAADRAVNRLDVWPTTRIPLAAPRCVSRRMGLEGPSRCVFYQSLGRFDHERRRQWDEAVRDELRAAALPLLRDAMTDPRGPFGALALRRVIAGWEKAAVSDVEARAIAAQPGPAFVKTDFRTTGIVDELVKSAPRVDDVIVPLANTVVGRLRYLDGGEPRRWLRSVCAVRVVGALARAGDAVPGGLIHYAKKEHAAAAPLCMGQGFFLGVPAGLIVAFSGAGFCSIAGAVGSAFCFGGWLLHRRAFRNSDMWLAERAKEIVGADCDAFLASVRDALLKEFSA